MATIPGTEVPPRSSHLPALGGGQPRSGSRLTAKNTSDPVLRNALRYTISAREYAALHNYVLSKSRLLKKHVPTVSTVERIMDGSEKPASDKAKAGRKKNGGTERNGDGADTFNARAVRHSMRVFIATGALMKLWNLVQAKLAARKKGSSVASKGVKTPFYKSPTLRLSLSLSTILLLYRLLFRFLTRLRTHLLDPTAAPWRSRNPRVSDALTSPYTPAVGASLAGLMLGVFPAKQMRLSMAIYMAFRALEFGWNALEDDGSIWGWKKIKGMRVMRERPWWFGSWMLQPFAFGQLLHALVFDRECFPKPFGDFIFKFSDTYLHPRPLSLPANLPWPRPYEVVDSLAEMARLSWPPYISPSFFPGKDTLPASLSAISALTANAHPAVTSLACATLHPQDPSCLRTHLMMWINTFMPVARYLLLFYSAMTLPRYKALYHAPVSTLRNLIARTLNMSTFVTGSISTAWASICFFQQWFPRHFLARQRFFLGGFLAGMWAWIERRHGRPAFLYSARLSVDSLWKVGVKRRWWRAMQGGDVWVFVLALLVSGVVYEKDAKAIKEVTWRRGISWVRGEGWRDYGIEEEGEGEDEMEDEMEVARQL